MVRWAVLALASGMLMACSGGTPPLFTNGDRVLDGRVALVAPRGYCVDPGAGRDSATAAFRLYGTCRGLNGRGPQAPAPAILTASVAATPADIAPQNMAQLAAHLKTPAGRKALARQSRAGAVEVIAVEQGEDVLFVHARDRRAGELSEVYWRAIFPQSGALFTLTVSGADAAPISSEAARDILGAFVVATRAANGGA